MHDSTGLSGIKNSNSELIETAKRIFDAAVRSVSAPQFMESAGDLLISGQSRVVGAGKAAMAMAAVLEQQFPECLFEGQVVVPHGYINSFPKGQSPPKTIRVTEGGHPVPDEGSRRAAADALRTARVCGVGDTLIVLLSGGASALWSLPSSGLTLEDLRSVNQTLLRSGANIHQINAVRKHLSAIKGGQLAKAAWPARTITLAVSDVVGDNESVIGSGPTVADPTTWDDVADVIVAYDLEIPPGVRKHLKLGLKGVQSDTPKPGSEPLERSDFQLLASNEHALKAAESAAEQMGYHIVGTNSGVHGEARDIGAAMARDTLNLGPGECVLWGGETTVTVHGAGKGGRNQELALAAACEFSNKSVDVVLLSGGTDGIDGPTDATGGWAIPGTVARARSMGIDPYTALEENDAYHCLRAVDQLLITGPTHTNVMDIGIGLRAHE
ncbi:MAG: DUF4147 domain-containing protein [Bacteroidota bacterium]|nr:DUF4147 domain-containing protein [Bacteroidota bacterium]